MVQISREPVEVYQMHLPLKVTLELAIARLHEALVHTLPVAKGENVIEFGCMRTDSLDELEFDAAGLDVWHFSQVSRDGARYRWHPHSFGVGAYLLAISVKKLSCDSMMWRLRRRHVGITCTQEKLR